MDAGGCWCVYWVLVGAGGCGWVGADGCGWVGAGGCWWMLVDGCSWVGSVRWMPLGANGCRWVGAHGWVLTPLGWPRLPVPPGAVPAGRRLRQRRPLPVPPARAAAPARRGLRPRLPAVVRPPTYPPATHPLARGGGAGADPPPVPACATTVRCRAMMPRAWCPAAGQPGHPGPPATALVTAAAAMARRSGSGGGCTGVGGVLPHGWLPPAPAGGPTAGTVPQVTHQPTGSCRGSRLRRAEPGGAGVPAALWHHRSAGTGRGPWGAMGGLGVPGRAGR